MKGILIALGSISAVAAAASALAFIGLPYRPLGVEFLQTNPYATPAITSQAVGSETPPQISNPTPGDVVENGDFSIFPINGETDVLGDGVNEVTLWDLDFTQDPAFEDFPTTTPLESARLTITLTPGSLNFFEDYIRLGDLEMMNPPIYADLPLGTPSTVELELLDFYSSQDILDALTEGEGFISMSSGDNAIVSSAELMLVAQGPVTNLGRSGGADLSGRVLDQHANPADFGGATVSLLGGGEPRTMQSLNSGPQGSLSVSLSQGSYRLIAAG
jgi:hypothetical protein